MEDIQNSSEKLCGKNDVEMQKHETRLSYGQRSLTHEGKPGGKLNYL